MTIYIREQDIFFVIYGVGSLYKVQKSLKTLLIESYMHLIKTMAAILKLPGFIWNYFECVIEWP